MAKTKYFIGFLMAVVAVGCDGGAIGSGDPGDSVADGGPENNAVQDGLGTQDPTSDGGSNTVSTKELCNGFDDDGDFEVDEGCSCKPGQSQACFPGPASGLKGACKQGTQQCFGTTEFGAWGKCVGAVLPRKEICDNTVDEDCDGKDLACTKPKPPVKVDAGLPKECTAGQKKACYTGPSGTLGKGTCKAGSQACMPNYKWGACVGSVLPRKEACGNGVDENCDGKDDACPGKVITVPVYINGDCVTASCPPQAPYPVGCNIKLAGGDPRGCVASSPTNPVIYFQEGDKCKKGKVQGLLYCSTKPGAQLSAKNCYINKSIKYYPTSKWGCPKTSG